MSTWIILLIFFLLSLLLRWKSAAVAENKEEDLLEEIKKNPKNLILYSEIMRPKFKEF